MKRTSQKTQLRVVLCPDSTLLQRTSAELPQGDVVLFPELADGGYRVLADGGGIHTVGDEYLERFRTASRTASCTCIGGTVALRGERHRVTNTCLVYQRGRLTHRYDKIHLFKPAGDTRFFAPGTSFSVFSIGRWIRGAKAGVIVCYDLRFPELTRALARAGIAVLFVPARWPAVRDDAWRTLLKARAIENQIFVVGCNARGREGGFSYVFDPRGNVVFSSRVDPSAPYYQVALDFSLLDEAKRLHNNLRDARLLKRIRIIT